MLDTTLTHEPLLLRLGVMCDFQDSLPGRTRSEGVLEGLFSRIGATAAVPGPPPPVSAPLVATEGSPAPSLRLTELALLAQQTLTNGDLGRVMQWAGTELALRDKKVNPKPSVTRTVRWVPTPSSTQTRHSRLDARVTEGFNAALLPSFDCAGLGSRVLSNGTGWWDFDPQGGMRAGARGGEAAG